MLAVIRLAPTDGVEIRWLSDLKAVAPGNGVLRPQVSG